MFSKHYKCRSIKKYRINNKQITFVIYLQVKLRSAFFRTTKKYFLSKLFTNKLLFGHCEMRIPMRIPKSHLYVECTESDDIIKHLIFSVILSSYLKHYANNHLFPRSLIMLL